MGRKSLNLSYEEMLEKKRNQANKYYSSNRDMINKKRREKYNMLKNKTVNKNN
jgi:hypothetical protein